MLWFNKEYRLLTKLFDNLFNKLKKSTVITQRYHENTEIYTLDSIDIAFEMVKNTIKVTDKTGHVICTLDCSYPGFGSQSTAEKLQEIRADFFHAFLTKSRETYDKAKQKAESAHKKVKANKEKASALTARQNAEQQRQAIIASALDKLKSM